MLSVKKKVRTGIAVTLLLLTEACQAQKGSEVYREVSRDAQSGQS